MPDLNGQPGAPMRFAGLARSDRHRFARRRRVISAGWPSQSVDRASYLRDAVHLYDVIIYENCIVTGNRVPVKGSTPMASVYFAITHVRGMQRAVVRA